MSELQILVSSNYSERVEVPSLDSINSGLTSPSSSFMIDVFGKPRTKLTTDCSNITNVKLLKQIKNNVSVGPFKVSGHYLAIESLIRIFNKVKTEKPDLYKAVGTAGMLCCRNVRGTENTPSNHSFGTAIDLLINGKLDSVGDGMALKGLIEIYKYFHEEGWYWGAEYKGSREDAMHFEVSKEKILKWKSNKLI